MMCVFFHLQQLTAQIFVTFINAINITITFEIAVNALATTNAFELMQIWWKSWLKCLLCLFLCVYWRKRICFFGGIWKDRNLPHCEHTHNLLHHHCQDNQAHHHIQSIVVYITPICIYILHSCNFLNNNYKRIITTNNENET
jgi:hypothetical protein